jgi:uncharacterized protein (DUF885 family)
MTPSRVFILAILLLCVTRCGGPAPSSAPAPDNSGNVAFDAAARAYLDDVYARSPTWATYLGKHKFNDRLEDYSRRGVEDALVSARQFRQRLSQVDSALLSPERQLDYEQLIRSIDSRIVTLDVIRPWAVDPDSYSSGLTRTAYIMIKRSFAPPEERLRQLIAREKAMPAALGEARKNLQNPPRIYTEIAIEQMDGNREFFETAVAAAFPTVTDKALLTEFKQANDAVIASMRDYKQWLQDDLLKRSNGNFAIGEDTYRRKLAADEMIEVPLDQLLQIAERDLRKNQAAFAEAARAIDPKRSPAEVLKSLEANHPPPEKLLATTQAELASLAKFLTDKRIITIPDAAPARVEETPPFLRATTSASMDIPGPFETVATEAYYNMTLPDAKMSAAQKNEFMTQWYYPLITNVSVHEVWPGHYLQFLYARHFTSDIRKVLGAASNSEGWAHYCEQMVFDEGFHAGEPQYRLAQIHDALLRDTRFVVGIRLHTQGMTLAEAEEYFVREGYQSRPMARSESKRGTSDPTYGYYTMGKLMILKLRDDYRAQKGSDFSLQQFHDAFVRLGPLPLPLVRKAMLGQIGSLF